MVENKDSPLCPIASFQKCLTKLNPENNRRWQRPRETFLDSDPYGTRNNLVEKITLVHVETQQKV